MECDCGLWSSEGSTAQHGPVQSNRPQNSCDLVLSSLSSTPSMGGHLEQLVDHEDPLNSVFHVSDCEMR
jgi:hypothetical protein